VRTRELIVTSFPPVLVDRLGDPVLRWGMGSDYTH
jgi:hypothetical protein